jgi:hypothetical protein
MTEPTIPEPYVAEINALKRQNIDLQQSISDIKQDFNSRLIFSELKAEAVRAGIIDLDGLKLLDLTKARMADDGKVPGANEMIESLKQRKPWLFQATSSSTAMSAPTAQPIVQKRATEMTDAEYRAARSLILGQHER